MAAPVREAIRDRTGISSSEWTWVPPRARKSARLSRPTSPKFTPHVPRHDTSKVFGAQLFMRSPNDRMGGFYTHLTNVPAGIGIIGTVIHRGDLLGRVHPGHGTPHLHLALVEIIGGAPNGRYMGVNLFDHFKAISNTTRVSVVTFNQNGTPPTFTP